MRWPEPLLSFHVGRLHSQADAPHLHPQEPEVGTSPWVFPGRPVAWFIPCLAASLAPDPTGHGFCSLLP